MLTRRSLLAGLAAASATHIPLSAAASGNRLYTPFDLPGHPEVGGSHGRLHFCGEHAGQANRGMEAAMESAERAVIAASAYL